MKRSESLITIYFSGAILAIIAECYTAAQFSIFNIMISVKFLALSLYKLLFTLFFWVILRYFGTDQKTSNLVIQGVLLAIILAYKGCENLSKFLYISKIPEHQFIKCSHPKNVLRFCNTLSLYIDDICKGKINLDDTDYFLKLCIMKMIGIITHFCYKGARYTSFIAKKSTLNDPMMRTKLILSGPGELSGCSIYFNPIYLKHVIMEELSVLTGYFKDEPLLRFYYSFHLYERLGYTQKSIIEIMNSEDLRYSSDISFAFYRLKNRIYRGIQHLNKNKDKIPDYSAFDIEATIVVGERFQKLIRGMSSFSKFYMRFFDCLLEEQPDLGHIQNLHHSIIQTRKMIDSLYSTLSDNPRSVTVFLNFIKCFFPDRGNVKYTQTKLRMLQAKIEGFIQESKFFFEPTLVFGKETTILKVGANLNNLGNILEVIGGAESLTGYTISELKGMNVSVFLPHTLKVVHDELMLSAYRTGIFHIIYRERVAFIISKAGYMKTIHFIVKIFYTLEENNFQYIAYMQPTNSSQDILFLTSDGMIEACTEGVSRRLGIKGKDIQLYGLYIFQLIEELCEFFFAKKMELKNPADINSFIESTSSLDTMRSPITKTLTCTLNVYPSYSFMSNLNPYEAFSNSPLSNSAHSQSVSFKSTLRRLEHLSGSSSSRAVLPRRLSCTVTLGVLLTSKTHFFLLSFSSMHYDPNAQAKASLWHSTSRIVRAANALAKGRSPKIEEVPTPQATKTLKKDTQDEGQNNMPENPSFVNMEKEFLKKLTLPKKEEVNDEVRQFIIACNQFVTKQKYFNLPDANMAAILDEDKKRRTQNSISTDREVYEDEDNHLIERTFTNGSTSHISGKEGTRMEEQRLTEMIQENYVPRQLTLYKYFVIFWFTIVLVYLIVLTAYRLNSIRSIDNSLKAIPVIAQINSQISELCLIGMISQLSSIPAFNSLVDSRIEQKIEEDRTSLTTYIGSLYLLPLNIFEEKVYSQFITNGTDYELETGVRIKLSLRSIYQKMAYSTALLNKKKTFDPAFSNNLITIHESIIEMDSLNWNPILNLSLNVVVIIIGIFSTILLICGFFISKQRSELFEYMSKVYQTFTHFKPSEIQAVKEKAAFFLVQINESQSILQKKDKKKNGFEFKKTISVISGKSLDMKDSKMMQNDKRRFMPSRALKIPQNKILFFVNGTLLYLLICIAFFSLLFVNYSSNQTLKVLLRNTGDINRRNPLNNALLISNLMTIYSNQFEFEKNLQSDQVQKEREILEENLFLELSLLGADKSDIRNNINRLSERTCNETYFYCQQLSQEERNLNTFAVSSSVINRIRLITKIYNKMSQEELALELVKIINLAFFTNEVFKDFILVAKTIVEDSILQLKILNIGMAIFAGFMIVTIAVCVMISQKGTLQRSVLEARSVFLLIPQQFIKNNMDAMRYLQSTTRLKL